MKKFIYKVDKDVTKEEYAEICNDGETRGAVLELYTLTTIFDNHTIANSIRKEILMTYWERQSIEEPVTLLESEQFWEQMPFPAIFKSKYKEALDVLQYTPYYRLMMIEKMNYRLMQMISSDDDDYSAPAMEHDEVAIFIDQIQSTL